MSIAPAFSMAATVLANVGDALFERIFSTSALCVSMALSMAGRKCAGLIFSKGGSSKGVFQAPSSGLRAVAAPLAFAFLSLMQVCLLCSGR